jgi:hypothetical protein
VPESPEVDATVERIESLVEQLGQADPQLRQWAEEAIRLLMQLYEAGLARAVEILGRENAVRLAEDRVVGSLLLLHGLHPVEPSERIENALRSLELGLDGHRLHVSSIAGGVARIRLEPSGGAVSATLAARIQRAVAESAPDIAEVEIEGWQQPSSGLVQIAPLVSD